jgi:hypothetical protein
LWQTDPAEFQRRVDERHERWAEREQLEYDAYDEADLARKESYGNEPIEDDEEPQP